MILILSLVIFANIGIIVFLIVRKRRETSYHVQKIAGLQAMIIALLENQKEQEVRLKLADELRETLKVSNSKLGNEILALQFEFLETLKKNNLIE